METFHKVSSTRVRIGNKSKGIELSCLAFADDLAIFAHSEEEARKQIEDLKEIAEKTCLQISFAKKQIMPNLFKYLKTWLETTYGEVKYIPKRLRQRIFKDKETQISKGLYRCV